MGDVAGKQLDKFLGVCILASSLLLTAFGLLVGTFGGFSGGMAVYTLGPILAAPLVLLYIKLRRSHRSGYGVCLVWAAAIVEFAAATFINVASCRGKNCDPSSPFLIAAWQIGNPEIWGWLAIALLCLAQASLVPTNKSQSKVTARS